MNCTRIRGQANLCWEKLFTEIRHQLEKIPTDELTSLTLGDLPLPLPVPHTTMNSRDPPKESNIPTTSLRCGHCPLKQFLHRIKAEENDKCETCWVKETTTHFLIYCKKFTKQRQALRSKIKEEKIKVDINSAIKLLDTPAVFPHLAKFVEDTGRFIHLKTYLE